jgi:hypothetical protein
MNTYTQFNVYYYGRMHSPGTGPQATRADSLITNEYKGLMGIKPWVRHRLAPQGNITTMSHPWGLRSIYTTYTLLRWLLFGLGLEMVTFTFRVRDGYVYV